VANLNGTQHAAVRPDTIQQHMPSVGMDSPIPVFNRNEYKQTMQTQCDQYIIALQDSS